MQLSPFKLERYFARYEFSARLNTGWAAPNQPGRL